MQNISIQRNKPLNKPRCSCKGGPTDVYYIPDQHYDKVNMLEPQSGLRKWPFNEWGRFGQLTLFLMFICVLQLQNCNCICSIELFENNFMYWDILMLLFLYWIVSAYLNLKLCFDS